MSCNHLSCIKEFGSNSKSDTGVLDSNDECCLRKLKKQT